MTDLPDDWDTMGFGELYDHFMKTRGKTPQPNGNGKWNAAEHVTFYTAEELKHKDFPPLQPIVPDIIVEGLTLLAGKPKVGKSWLLLHTAIAVANGGYTLGQIKCAPGDTCYFALEDSERRMKSRMDKLGLDFPSRLHFCHEIPRLSHGGFEVISGWVNSHPEARCVMIDTLQMVRDRTHADGPVYERDYEALLELRTLANERHIGLIVSHHLRKAGADDVFDTVSGSLGLTGCPDSILVLSRHAETFMLHGKGRDLPDFARPMRFDEHACTWRLLENAETRSPRDNIVAILSEHGPLRPAEIALLMASKPNAIRQNLLRMKRDEVVEELPNGKYQLVDNVVPFPAS